MRLIYKATRKPVQIGDRVYVRDQPCTVDYFCKPRTPASEGKVTLKLYGDRCASGREVYVSVIGAEWIEREGRTPPTVAEPSGNLYEAMTYDNRNALALLLGFDMETSGTREAAGFRLNLKAVPALPPGFTLGDALAAYCAFLGSKGAA